MKALLRALACIVCLFCSPVMAHDSRPLSVNITEQEGHAYLARMRVPPSVELDNRPVLAWPQDCRALNAQSPEEPGGEVQTILIACRQPIEGRALAVGYPVYNPSLPTLFRLKQRDGTVLTQLLAPDQPSWQVPARPSRGAVARSYVKLGIEHIWGGIDHLLFVTGLLILAGSMRPVLLAITGFTLAHSVTLTLSALGLVHLPVPPVEAAIALSILFLAREIALPAPDGLARRYPIAVSSSFGLLHGFGFAAALREVGLPSGELATGLLCFNLGVEIGQIAFIGGAIGLFLAGRAIVRRTRFDLARLRPEYAGYVLGLPAAFWFIQRLDLAL